MSQKQELYAQSLAQQLLTVWAKLGDSSNEEYHKYRIWTEESIHNILHDAGKSNPLRTSFGGETKCNYTADELFVCIAHMQRMLNGYKSIWMKQWQGERAEREARKLELERVVADCLTYGQVMQYLTDKGLSYDPAEVFEYVDMVGKTSYFRRREQPVKLYTLPSAMRTHRMLFGDSDTGFDDAFALADTEGFSGTFYRALFEQRVAV